MLELADPIRLQVESSDAWLSAALAAPERLLDDHAQCELKAAVNALALVGRHSEHDRLVRSLGGLAVEELRHYRQVRALLRARGGTPSRPLRSPYLVELTADRRGGARALLEELLIAAVIEARSCERFERLAAAFAPQEPQLARLYADLVRSERGHAARFVDLARDHYPAAELRRELERLLALEARILERLAVSPRMHGGHCS
jgi:tRNA-(ms[2]io[6]A)-hydroxylase